MFDETGLMNSANGKFDFIKHLNFHQKPIKQLIPLFDEMFDAFPPALTLLSVEKQLDPYFSKNFGNIS